MMKREGLGADKRGTAHLWLQGLGREGLWDPLPGASETQSLSRAGGERLEPHARAPLPAPCIPHRNSVQRDIQDQQG